MGKVEFDYPNSITLLRQVIAVMDVRPASSKMRQSIRSKALLRKRILVLLLGFPAFAMVLAQIPQGFSPPDERQRANAIGATNSLPKNLRRAFAPSPDFSPIPTPGRSDWLASHKETGQTYAQYVRSRPNRPRGNQSKIYLQPIGKFDEGQSPELEKLTSFAGRFFNLPVESLPSVKAEEIGATTRDRGGGRRQLLTTDVLAWLERRIKEDAYCLLAVTMEDLYPADDWNFVFGQASLRNRVGVYSLVRYHPSFYRSTDEPDDETTERIILERSCKVLAHETGHMFGIKHCIHFHCLMNGSNHLAESDAQPIHLCPVCLRKLRYARPFDVEDRYRKLLEFSDSANWGNESLWLLDRLRAIEE